MGDGFGLVVKDLFYLGILMLILVYFGGGVKLLQAIGPQLVSVDYAATGRTPQGTFPNYPGGGPVV